jgi:hypothetical protein
VELWAVLVREVEPPAEGEPIEWLLLTTVAVDTVDDVIERVHWYKDLQPHLIRYWLTPAEDPQFDAKVSDICTLYHEAPAALAEQGARIVSTDELTGVHALERKSPGLPMAPGKVERREFAYIRHGTCAFILSRDVATGQVIAPDGGPTRTAADFLAHVQSVVATDPQATRWHCVVDNLDTHRSASLVQWVAEVSGLRRPVGIKGREGILHNRQSRAAFLPDPSHRIVFQYTPKHCSWLNQIEIWLSILVRKGRKRGSFVSVERLKTVDLPGKAIDGVTLEVFRPTCTSG